LSERTHAEKLTSGALWYANKGWKLLPCYGINSGGRCTCGGPHTEPKDAGKHPAIGEWNSRATDDATAVGNWWSNGSENNIGVYCQGSGFIVIDIDPRSGGIASFEKLEEMLEHPLPKTVEATTGVYTYNGVTARGRHLYFKVNEGEQFQGNLKAAGLNGIDIKYNGYVMVAPSRHQSGVQYEWIDGCAPWQTDMADAPEDLLQIVRKRARRNGTTLGNGEWDWMDGLEYAGERVEIAKMLEDGIDEGSRAVDIYKLTCALANKFGVDTPEKRLMIETMMIRFNYEKVRPPLEMEGMGGLLMHVRRAIDFVAENPIIERMYPGLSEWASRGVDGTGGSSSVAAKTPALSVTRVPATGEDVETNDYSEMHSPIGLAIGSAAQGGLSVSGAFSNSNVDVPINPDALSIAEGGDPERRSLSDVGNGRRIVDSFGNVIRYTPGIGWFVWDGQYWKPDNEDLELQEISKNLATIVATETAKYADDDKKREVVKWAWQARSNSRMRSAIESAKSDPRIVNSVSAWDNDNHLLGVLNGVINLKTGELLQGRPDLHITKRAPVAYIPGMRNVRWEQFIDFATGGDKELQDWIQRAVGYTMTGLSNQDVLFLVYGPGGSGKNTFVETIVEALGTEEYANKLRSEVLASDNGMASSSDQYYMAELRGKRMIWVDELPESERLKENQVKSLTGSGTIQARSPGEKPFTFKAQGKLWITTNHRPMITDDAMWRRIRPIPWTHIPENSDPDLKAYLSDPEGGLPAVLAWAVEGAIKYLNSQARDPLGWCTAVSEAADMYKKNEDRLGMFLEEETKESEDGAIFVKDLFQIYRRWSEDRGEKHLSTIRFTRKLQDRGEDITGTGASAVMHGRIIPPRAVPNSHVNWGDIAQSASSSF
jgi:putative DNA primase/helicase